MAQKSFTLGLIAACLFSLLFGTSEAAPKRRGNAGSNDSATTMTEARAVWVPRGQWKGREDVARIMENAAAVGFNIVLFQVRGNGTVYYKSAIEPWAFELTSTSPATTGKDPGWDPLQVAIEEAHRRGLKLHAWFNVFPGWRGQQYPPAEAKQLWTEHPDWFMVRKNGEKMIARDIRVDPKTPTWYSFINPAHPEVQKYIPKIFVEVVKNYDIDGIHYDYVRYPSEIEDFSYDPVSLSRFKQETGATPDEKPQEWIDWRSKQVTEIVRDIYEQVTAIKPDLVVGGAVIANFPRAKDKYFARSQQWLKEGILDVAMPMNYHHGTEFTTQTENFVANDGGRHIYMGMSGGADTSGTRSRDRGTSVTTPDTDAAAATATEGEPTIVKEIRIVREAGAEGVAVFSLNSLVGRDGQMNRQGKILKEGPFKQPAAVPEMPWKGKKKKG